VGTIGFVGGGNMAEALIKGIITAGVYKAEDIYVSDIREERLEYLASKYGVRRAASNSELASSVETVVLSVKPQNMADAVGSIKAAINEEVLVISIMAGKTVSSIGSVLGDVGIVRVMPNTPALIGEGASALFANDRAKPMLEKAKLIFSSVGRAVVVDDEGMIDAVTAVSGSGPAYYFLLMEEMINAAVELGLSEAVAKELVLQTAKGSALLSVESDKKGESVGELRRKVTSPGGTTEAALGVFSEGGFGQLVGKAIGRARDRSRELSM